MKSFSPSVIKGGLDEEQINSDEIEVPVLGKIAAGTPVEAIQNEVSRIPLPNNLEKNGDYFGLKVQGDSMIDAGIHEGDTVIIKRTDTADNGKIVVALIDEHEAMLKRIRKKGKVVATTLPFFRILFNIASCSSINATTILPLSAVSVLFIITVSPS